MKGKIDSGVGLAAGFRTLDSLRLADLSVRAERAGFDRFIMQEAWRETIVPLAACAMLTERIGIGSGVLQIFPVNPIMVAVQAAELQELSGGRFTLGLGVGASFVVSKWFGVRYTQPLQRMREFLEVVRGVHASANGRAFSYDGSLFSVRKYKIGDRPVSPIPLRMAAIGPRMQELAGELADGVMIGAVHSQRYLDEVRDRTAIGAARSGRDPSHLDISYTLITACHPDSEHARFLARRSIMYLCQHEHYLKRFRQEGFGRVADEVNILVRGHQEDEAERLVSDRMLEKFSVAGSSSECREQLRSHLYRGATPVLALVPFRIPERQVIDSHFRVCTEVMTSL